MTSASAAVSVRNMSWTTTKVFLRAAGSMSKREDGVGADDVEGGEVAGWRRRRRSGAGRGRRRAGTLVLGVRSWVADGDVAGEEVGEEAHVGCAAGVDVVGEQGELCGRGG